MLCVSELAGNCVSHSVSGCPAGTFTVRVERHDGDYVWLEVADQGGPWRPSAPDGRVHGLEIVRRLASESGVAGSMFTGWEAWARLDWPGQRAAGRALGAVPLLRLAYRRQPDEVQEVPERRQVSEDPGRGPGPGDLAEHPAHAPRSPRAAC